MGEEEDEDEDEEDDSPSRVKIIDDFLSEATVETGSNKDEQHIQ